MSAQNESARAGRGAEELTNDPAIGSGDEFAGGCALLFVFAAEQDLHVREGQRRIGFDGARGEDIELGLTLHTATASNAAGRVVREHERAEAPTQQGRCRRQTLHTVRVVTAATT
jgi:hypothetical protein